MRSLGRQAEDAKLLDSGEQTRYDWNRRSSTRKREVNGHQASWGAQISQDEDADLSARTAPGGGGRAGRPPARPPGGRAAVLQRRALGRPAPPAPDAGRPRLAGGPRPPPHSAAGAAGRPFRAARAPPVFRGPLPRGGGSAADRGAGRGPGERAGPPALPAPR